MTQTPFTLTSEADGIALRGYSVAPRVQPKGVVVLAHGMAEHSDRYRRLADALAAAGYAVYAYDHRGHGRTAGPEHWGDMGTAGWEGLIADLGQVVRHARSEHPELRVALMGHSMGSFAAQQYLLDHSAEVDAVGLSGSTAVDLALAEMDPEAQVDLSAFNAPFAPARTDFDWLSRDPDEVDKYVADPGCGYALTTASTAGMLAGTKQTGDPERIAGVRSDLPVYLFSGQADPIAAGGDLVELVGQRYRDAGLTDVTVTIYPEARHEVFNETNRDEVTADFIAFLDRTI